MSPQPRKPDADADNGAPSVANAADNAKLEHTAGGKHTRDGMDGGVPVIQGDPREPIGPEDALGPGPKRGDYSDRLVTGPSMRVETIPADERRQEAEKIAAASDGVMTPAQAMAEVPSQRLVAQAPAADNIGDAPGKGGVPGTAPR